jgi:tetratricopeptide (TPR) repeat protein
MAAALSVVVYVVRQTGEPVAWTERLSQVPRAYLVYLRRIFWPSDLATPYPALEQVTLLQAAAASIAVLALTFWAIRSRRQRPYLMVGWLWFLITLAPVIGFIQVGGHPMADRWMYVPMIGVLIMLAWGLPSLLPRARPMKIALGTAGLVVLIALSAVTHAQIGYWQNTETLFRRAIAVTERNRLAHYNLAWFLAKQGRADEAVVQYRRAIEIEPTHFASHHNLGLLLIQEGRQDEALEPICAALRLADPDDEALRKRLAEHLEGAPCP